ncbi:NAD(P)H-dependent FMN reductase [Fodinibius salinus]|uniref:NAD(P)H-dependent FMN reductase n=1 Tax=Fodinibius salinus TaxID=860790 RepID=A0A5D3YPG8_9BACT|nr:NAD(P)H-dependent oxidoreductase [Fodinibius salinus]TYP95128.1 NAD(P)H-dependent FMN reductase [Fodinibius salinus]
MDYNIAVIYGSVRHHRKGMRAARFITEQCINRDHDATLVDPTDFDLPLLDKMYKEFEDGEAPDKLEQLAQIIRKADGYIIVSAEYNHSIPPALSNLLDHFLEEYFFKPSGIVCYSKGHFGGVRAAMQLRSMLAEMGMSSIPSILPIPKITEAFTKDGIPNDDAYYKRSAQFLDEFEWYLRALKKEREHDTPY